MKTGMVERVLFPEYKSTIECCFNHDDQIEPAELRTPPQGDSIMNEKKNKKKKKCKGGPQSPKRIIAFNTSEWLKLDEDKAESKKCTVGKKLSKCATFPARTSESCKVTNAGTEHAEGSEDSEESDKQSSCTSPYDNMSLLMRCCSLPLKSALRGGYEELGLGPRAKLHVKWAPSVWEPPRSIISHTLNHYPSKKDLRKKQRGKISHDDLYKKHVKKTFGKGKHSSESTVLRIQEDFHKVRVDGYLHEKRKSKSCGSGYETESKTELLEEECNWCRSCQTSEIEVACKSSSGVCFETAEQQTGLVKNGAVDGFQSPTDSKCQESFLGIVGTQCKLAYGEAMEHGCSMYCLSK